MTSLKERTIANVIWSVTEKIGTKSISIITTIILARLLLPKDFGLIGMLTVFIAVSQGIADGGFNQALIQKKDADNEDYSSVFYINLSVSFLLYFILYISAPGIADFYNQPLLIDLTRVLSLVFVINSFSYVQKSKMYKEMKFKKLMMINLPSTIISAIVAIIMAYSGYGVWSLVVQQLVSRTIFAIQIWLYAKWKPLLVFNLEKIKNLFSFGSRLMLSTTLNKIYDNAYLIIIGKFFSVETLGYYKNADNLVKTPTDTLSSAIKAVTFPVFSSVQDDNKKLMSGYKKAMQQVLFWVCPLMIISTVMATPLFNFVLTEKWLPAVPFFQILCVIGIVKPLSDFNLELVAVKGKSGLYLRLNVLKKIIQTIGIIITIPMGIWALMYFLVIYTIIKYFIHAYYSGKFIGYTVKRQLLDTFAIILSSCFVGVVVYLVNLSLNSFSDLSRLLLCFIIGGGIYLLIAKVLNMEPYYEIIKIIKDKFLKK